MHITMKQLFKPILLLIVVALVGGMLIFFNLNKASVDNELAALYLIPQPERLTELYFENNVGLPSVVTGKQAVSFAFVIHNVETTDYQYVYNVSINANGVRHIVDRGTIVVKNNQYYTRNEQFKLINVRGRQDVIIELTNKRQSIDFWITNS